MNAVKHIAISMDGNGRWAKARGKQRKIGHIAGAKNVFAITKACIKLQIPYLTLYAFSTENWGRPKIEVDFLMSLLDKYLKSKREMYIKHKVCFNTIGDMTGLSQRLQDKIAMLKHDTKGFSTITQTLAINYGGRDEIVRAFCKIAKDSDVAMLDKDSMFSRIESNLDTYPMPPVDIIIRTGGDKRLSNFLLWQCSYAELFFTDTLWPDFSEEELEDILEEFSSRDRKFGKIES